MTRRQPIGAARFAALLGVEPERAGLLLAAMGARVGRRSYAARMAVFLVATGPARRLLPVGVRRRGIRAVVGGAVKLPRDELFYLGEADTLAGDACRGLLRS